MLTRVSSALVLINLGISSGAQIMRYVWYLYKKMQHVFTDVKFMTAKDKTLVFKQWVRFMKFLATKEWREWNDKQGGSDYGMEAPKVFTDRIYKHLSLHCGFIAHYNIHGFYSTYFSGSETDIENFFSHISSWEDHKDITGAMLGEYAVYKDRIMGQFHAVAEDKFELLKELVKRSETDMDLRKTVVAKLM